VLAPLVQRVVEVAAESIHHQPTNAFAAIGLLGITGVSCRSPTASTSRAATQQAASRPNRSGSDSPSSH
jgi:hypothetical protein